MRIGVPSGVGDVYWCLSKLQAFRRARNVDHVTLCVQKSRFTRALAWAEMVDFVDAMEEYPFRPDERALWCGYSDAPAPAGRRERRELEGLPPLDCVFWPNAVIDTGRHIREWMPELELDLSFPVKTEQGPAGRVVVYVSSESVNNAWLPGLGADYWNRLIAALADRTGERPTLIGASWDAAFRDKLTVDVEDLVGSTSLPVVAGILERASVVVGVICGMTIVANHFRTPTVALYPSKFPRSFPHAWVADGAPYVPIVSTAVPSPEELAVTVDRLRRGGRA